MRVDAEVIRNESDGLVNRRIVLSCPGFEGFDPGQFVMLSAGARTDVVRFDPLLPRPMAIYRTARFDGGAEVEILYKVHGRGTELLAEARPGQRCRLVGPLGRGFELPQPGERALLVGGGTGVASLYELAVRARALSPVRVLLGARSASDLLGVGDFEALEEVGVEVATEDGTRGQAGRVTALLERELEAAGPARVYACGPTAMMRACAALASERMTPCVVSLENTMACGFGVCLGCAVPLTGEGFGLVCRRGPVFESHEIDWAGLP